MSVKHPAPFSDEVINALIPFVAGLPHESLVLDPFAGTGRVHRFSPFGIRTVGVELEPEWANMHRKTLVGNALHLPFADETFDAIVTSPTYGNRMADHHDAKDGSRRRSYTHDIRAMTGDETYRLHPDNSGSIHWGPRYRRFHEQAWLETWRVLKRGGYMILNISNHIRAGHEQMVVEWHTKWWLHYAYLRDLAIVETHRMKHGQNHEARVENEFIIKFEKF